MSRLDPIRTLVVVVLLVAIASYFVIDLIAPDAPEPVAMSFEELTGSVFLPAPKDAFRSPKVRELPLPSFENATSVWGSLGRDARGHIWVGVSAANAGKSAHLFEYDPAADAWRDHGSVVAQLEDAALLRGGLGQVKIHSRIVTAQDGWLYFASTDEEGEDPRSGALPKSGGHLWRIHPIHHHWQHLLAVPEGLVAVSGVGRFVYALGYWGHVLYQYDTATRETKRVAVGSVDGHVSRNVLSDIRGHAYVPRVARELGGEATVQLVEFDETLREVGSTPLASYLGRGSPGNNHGIVGLAYLPDGKIAFTTHIGYLYVIEPSNSGKASVTEVGALHPKGEAYAPSLFQLADTTLVAGVVQRQGRFEWVLFDLSRRLGGAFPLDTADLQKVLLYGSVARDNEGRAYVGGWAAGSGGGQRPLVLQIDPGS